MNSHKTPIQEHEVFPPKSSAFLAPSSFLPDRSHQFQVAPFDVLPDDPLLSIFDFYVREDEDSKEAIETWQSLVHVCQRWRRLVFESPRRLNLRLVYTPQTPIRLLDVWPDLPLCIHSRGELWTKESRAAFKNDAISLLKNTDRICQFIIMPPSSVYECQLPELLAVMQVPFPKLTGLHLRKHSLYEMRDVPDLFLGGSAPRLQDLKLTHIPFPGLPKLLLSATHLVNLHLVDIPPSGYVSPKAMVTCLSLLTSLRKLILKFHWESFSQYRSDPSPNQHPSPSTRLILPALTCFEFDGVNKYLDDLVANLDAPQLRYMTICFSERREFQSRQLARLINRVPRLDAPEAARIDLTYSSFMITFYYSEELHPGTTTEVVFEIKNRSAIRSANLLVSNLAQAFISSLPLLSSVERLFIYELRYPMNPLKWGDGVEEAPWLALLRPFTAVKKLYLSGECAEHIARDLQDLDGRNVTEVLPDLESIFLGYLVLLGPTSEILQQFVSARQKLTGTSIAISPGEWYSWCQG